MKSDRKRLDMILVERGLAESRHQAQGLILSGKVKTDGAIQTKAGTFVSPMVDLEILAPPPFVGRGGVKLKHALDIFDVSPKDKVCLDVGASTGGFTDCLLQEGATKVYAVDVGRGQLAWKLRQDPRVVCLEKVNARYLSLKEVPEPIDLCTVDVSFISVQKILPAVKPLLKKNGQVIVLLKPQFEAGRKEVKKGVVRNRETHLAVLRTFLDWAVENHFSIRRITYSPITGANGNIEFLVHLEIIRDRHTFYTVIPAKAGIQSNWTPAFAGVTSENNSCLSQIVDEAHEKLGSNA